MAQPFTLDRRRFLGTAAMTLAAAGFGTIGGRGIASIAAPLTALDRATGWLNSAPVSAASLAGKVVLVQFGTYTCINWLRTLPYIRAWGQRYAPELVIIGVHTPEFGFEKNIQNVRRAMQQMNVGFPIAIDNDYAIWRAFDNSYWPAVYLIDGRGRLRHQQFGESDYEGLERKVQRLLADSGATTRLEGAAPPAPAGAELPADWGNLRSPENYLGFARTQNFASPEGARSNRSRVYTAPAGLKLNRWALAGEWTMGGEAALLVRAPGRVVCRFHARDLHLVMGPRRADTTVRFRVLLDGQPPGAARGLDLDAGGMGLAADQRMYQLIRQPKPIVDRTFEIELADPGVDVFALTFG